MSGPKFGVRTSQEGYVVGCACSTNQVGEGLLINASV